MIAYSSLDNIVYEKVPREKLYAIGFDPDIFICNIGNNLYKENFVFLTLDGFIVPNQDINELEPFIVKEIKSELDKMESWRTIAPALTIGEMRKQINL